MHKKPKCFLHCDEIETDYSARTVDQEPVHVIFRFYEMAGDFRPDILENKLPRSRVGSGSVEPRIQRWREERSADPVAIDYGAFGDGTLIRHSDLFVLFAWHLNPRLKMPKPRRADRPQNLDPVLRQSFDPLARVCFQQLRE
jgi:hypothetical protein